MRAALSLHNWKLDLQTRLLFALKQDANQLPNLFKYLYMQLNMPGEKWLDRYTRIAPYLFTGLLVLAWFFPVTLAYLDRRTPRIGMTFRRDWVLRGMLCETGN